LGEVFAGFIAGFIVALVATPILAITLLRMRTGSELLARLMPAETPVAGIAVLLHGALTLLWTGLGIILGLVLLAMRDMAAGLGSPNGVFTVLVVGVSLSIFAPVAALLSSLRRQVIAFALVVIPVYGWLMPYMAEWSRF
jgi:hypothetical protein